MRKVRYIVVTFFSFYTVSTKAYCMDNLVAQDENIYSMIFKFVLYFIAFIAVLLLTFYGTKFIAKYSRKLGKGSNIELLDQFGLGNHNKIVVVRIYSKIYFLSISGNQTTVIDKIDEKDISLKGEESLDSNRDFEKHLDSVLSSIDKDSVDLGLNDKLTNMKMKVMKLKNNKINNLEDKEEDYE